MAAGTEPSKAQNDSGPPLEDTPKKRKIIPGLGLIPPASSEKRKKREAFPASSMVDGSPLGSFQLDVSRAPSQESVESLLLDRPHSANEGFGHNSTALGEGGQATIDSSLVSTYFPSLKPYSPLPNADNDLLEPVAPCKRNQAAFDGTPAINGLPSVEQRTGVVTTPAYDHNPQQRRVVSGAHKHVDASFLTTNQTDSPDEVPGRAPQSPLPRAVRHLFPSHSVRIPQPSATMGFNSALDQACDQFHNSITAENLINLERIVSLEDSLSHTLASLDELQRNSESRECSAIETDIVTIHAERVGAEERLRRHQEVQERLKGNEDLQGPVQEFVEKIHEKTQSLSDQVTQCSVRLDTLRTRLREAREAATEKDNVVKQLTAEKGKVQTLLAQAQHFKLTLDFLGQQIGIHKNMIRKAEPAVERTRGESLNDGVEP